MIGFLHVADEGRTGDSSAIRVDQEERHFTALRKWELACAHEAGGESPQFHSQLVASEEEPR